MGTNTTNYNLYKPDVGEQDWGALVNTNSWDAIDTQMKANADAAAGAVSNLQGAFDGGQTITIADTDNQTLTITNNDTTNNQIPFYVNNFGTGTAAQFVQRASSAGSSGAVNIESVVAQTTSSSMLLRIVQATGSTQTAVHLQNAGTGNGLLIDQNGNGVSLNIDSEATTATVVNIASVNTSGVVLDVRNAGAGGQAAYFANTNGSGAGTSVGIDNSGTGHGLVINQVPATDAGRQALRVFMTTDRTIADTALVKFEDQGSSTTEPTLEVRTGGGSGIELFNAGTGNGLLIDQNGNGVALKIDNAGTSADIEMNATGGGIIFPTSDPNIAGAWWDDTGTLTKSSG